MEIIKSIIVTFGFFTTIPVPYIEWEEKYFRFIPIFLPLVGLVIGCLAHLVLIGVEFLGISALLKAILITLYFIVITGGLHLDAVMDTADAHFSRRDMKRKLEIMKDSRVGAFAVVAVFSLLVLKVGIINEYIIQAKHGYYLIVIPVVSRSLQALMLYNSPYATKEGISSMYVGRIKKYDQLFIIAFLASVLAIGYIYFRLNILVIIVISVFYFLYYIRFATKQFGGITGDVIGAFLEILEVLIFIGVVLI